MRGPSARMPTPRTAALLLLLFASSRVASCGANPIDAHALHLRGEEDGALRLLVRQASSDNLQTFGGSLGGKSAAAISNSGNDERVFEVDGDTFVSSYFYSCLTCVPLGFERILEKIEFQKG